MVFTSHKKLSRYLNDNIKSQKSIGLVPTMGALHDGHIALMKRALEDNDFLVVSIFVNPTQFNNSEDLEKYPRLLEQDQIKIETQLNKERIAIYAPSVEDVYGTTTRSKVYNFGGLEHVMEGAHRPGHFDGVGTILEFLFKVVEPDKAYFGEKDFQQLQIIKRLVAQLGIDIEIIGCPIHREESGLAMSSRNGRLTEENFHKAAQIYKTLSHAKSFFKNNSIQQTTKFVEAAFQSLPDFTLEYFTIADEQTLTPSSTKESNKDYRAFIVAHLQGVRLIDNIPLY